MSSSVAPYPSSDSKCAFSHSEIRRCSTTQSSTSSSLAPVKEAWRESSSSSSPKIATKREVAVTKYPDNVFLISVLLDKIAQYAPNLNLPLVNKAFHKTTSQSISTVVYQKFIMRNSQPRVSNENTVNQRQIGITAGESAVSAQRSRINSEGKSPLNPDKSLITSKSMNADLEETVVTSPSQLDYKSIWKNLPQYHQQMEAEYYTRISLTQYSDYILQTLPYGILLSKELPPFSIYWREEELAKKKETFKLYSSGELPSNLQIGPRILRWMSYFLEETSPSANSSTPVAAFSKTAHLIQLMLKANESNPQELQLEIKKRIAEKPLFLSRLFRYIFDQLFISKNSDYRLELYLMATTFVTHCDQYLSNEDLHYALLIHLYMALTRIDVVSKDQLLNPELINLIFNKIKIKKAALNQAKQPQLRKRTFQEPDLRQDLQIFLSTKRYEVLTKKLAKTKGIRPSLLKPFPEELLNDCRYKAVLEIIEKNLPGFTNELSAAKNSCCVIL